MIRRFLAWLSGPAPRPDLDGVALAAMVDTYRTLRADPWECDPDDLDDFASPDLAGMWATVQPGIATAALPGGGHNIVPLATDREPGRRALRGTTT